VLLTGGIGMPYVDEQGMHTVRLHKPKFWTTRFYASAAWTFSDSGVTNITALATAVVAILASTGATEIFTADLSPFIVMNVACGGIVAAAPILFAVCNVIIARGNPVVTTDATLEVGQDATITLPYGASIAVSGGATVTTAAKKSGQPGIAKPGVKAGGTIPVPPGSVLVVRKTATMALPSGSVLAIGHGATLTVDTRCQIAAGDVAPLEAARAKGTRKHCFRRRQPPAAAPAPAPGEIAAKNLITLTGGATVTVPGAADILLPKATVKAPGRDDVALKQDTILAMPAGTNVMAAGMGSVLPTAALTTFGAGAEIGLIAVLAAHYSKAGGPGQTAAIVISSVVAAVLVLYGATAIRALADPAPGTSLSSAAGASFTL
jgi:hypothetical protein